MLFLLCLELGRLATRPPRGLVLLGFFSQVGKFVLQLLVLLLGAIFDPCSLRPAPHLLENP